MLMHIVSYDSRENILSPVVGARRVFACRTVHTKAQCLQPHCMSLEFAGGEGDFCRRLHMFISIILFLSFSFFLFVFHDLHRPLENNTRATETNPLSGLGLGLPSSIHASSFRMELGAKENNPMGPAR